MAIEKFYFTPRSQKSMPEREYNRYKLEVEWALEGQIDNFQNMKTKGIWQARDPESILPHISGKDRALDLIIVDDEHDVIAHIYNQCEENGAFERILAVDHPETMQWILGQKNIHAPKIITLDFRLLPDEPDRNFKIAESLYIAIKEKWPYTCVIGLTNTERQPDARALENLIRSTGENVLDKQKFIEVLSHLFRDRLVMHDLRLQTIELEAQIREKDERLKEQEEENRRLKEEPPSSSGKAYLVGKSWVMREVYREIKRIKESRNAKTVLIEGPTGSGKKTIARAIIENWGVEKHEPVRCGVLTQKKLHEIFLANPKGAIIFDGLENLSLHMQEHLIEVIGTGKFRIEGKTELYENDAKFILLCSEPIKDLRANGKISETFYSLISTYKIAVPPLKNREEDIVLLHTYYESLWIEQFHPFQSFALPKDSARFLRYYDFPNNVRELESILRRAMEDAYSRTSANHESKVIFLEKFYFEDQIPGPKEEELTQAKNFLDEVETDAQSVCLALGIFPEQMKQKNLEEVTGKKNYRQKIDNFFKIGKRKEVVQFLLAREIENWPTIRYIRPFKDMS